MTSTVDEISPGTPGSYGLYLSVTEETTVDIKVKNRRLPGFPMKLHKTTIEANVEAVAAERQQRQHQIEHEEFEKLVTERVAEKRAAAAAAAAKAKKDAELKAAHERANRSPAPKVITPAAPAGGDHHGDSEDVSSKPASSLRNMFETKTATPAAGTPTRPAGLRATPAFLKEKEKDDTPTKTVDAGRPAPKRGNLASMWEQKLAAEKK